jgi:hypothetical protein
MPADYPDFAIIAAPCPRGRPFNIRSATIAVRLESALPFRPPLLQANPEPFQARTVDGGGDATGWLSE